MGIKREVNCDCRVALQEIAEVLHQIGLAPLGSSVASVRDLAAAAGVTTVRADWSGRPSLTHADAARVVAEAKRQRQQRQIEADEQARVVAAARAAAVGPMRVR